MNINSAINEGSLILKKNFIPTPQLDSELLMSKVTKKDRKDIILIMSTSSYPDEIKTYEKQLKEDGIIFNYEKLILQNEKK